MKSFLGEYGLVMGEWVVTGCVVIPLFLGSLSRLDDTREVNKRCMVSGWVQVGGC